MDLKVMLWYMLDSMVKATPTLIDKYIDEVILAPKYQMLEELEKDAILEPLHEKLKNVLATSLEPYVGKEIEIGHTLCPYCNETYQKLKPKILAGKADVLWLDQDPLGAVLVSELEIDEVPKVYKVKKEKDSIVLIDKETKQKLKIKDRVKLD
ncbi:MAG: hypothetical protein QW750_08410 [Zestosphaera sp.]